MGARVGSRNINIEAQSQPEGRAGGGDTNCSDNRDHASNLYTKRVGRYGVKEPDTGHTGSAVTGDGLINVEIKPGSGAEPDHRC